MPSVQYEAIFNDGERLIPGESHDLAETVRHKSSYRFFRHIIETDLQREPRGRFRVLDLGCGVGHGSHYLSSLPGAEIVGIDPSAESVEYARANYGAQNISYVNVDAEAFLERDETFDYIVSRHALEHIENGLDLARRYHCSRRLMINVPYKEPEGNIHHKIHFIEESSFEGYDGAEFFFEDMTGVTETAADKLDFANSIICVLTRDKSPKIIDMLQFPFRAWEPVLQERILIETSASVRQLQAQLTSLNDVVQHAAQANVEIAASVDALRLQLDQLKNEIASNGAEIEGTKALVEATKAEVDATNAEVNAIRGTFLFRVIRGIATIIQR